MKIPFQERKSKWRGLLDAVSGCYPRFLTGGSLGNILPVFHFHDVTAEYLEPYFIYLAENGYKTVVSDAIGKFVREGVSPGDRSVVLSFDDALASLWTDVAPLLKTYGFQAITYVVPGRINDAEAVRPTIDTRSRDIDDLMFIDDPFVTWAELKTLAGYGAVDIQSHTYSHAKIFCSDALNGFLNPGSNISMLSRPILTFGEKPVFATEDMLGCPLYPTRSRMSDALRYIDDDRARVRCLHHVRESGHTDYFKGDSWYEDLKELAQDAKGRFETEQERADSIRGELTRAKEMIEHKLCLGSVRQVCMPWGICGKVAEGIAKDVGYETVVADELWGKRFVVAGGNPYRIMRLKHDYIYCLPGSGRKRIFDL